MKKITSLILLAGFSMLAWGQSSFSLKGDGNWYRLGRYGGRHAYIAYKYSHSTAHNPSIATGEILFINAKSYAIQNHHTMGYGKWNQPQFAVINLGNYSELWVKATEGVAGGSFIITDNLNISLSAGDAIDSNLTDNGGTLKIYDKLKDNAHTYTGQLIVDGSVNVAGNIKAHEIEVTLAAMQDLQLNGTLAANNITYTANGNTADFVFEDNYQLKDLSEVEAFIKANKHLPEIPSAKEMEEAGVNLAEMNKLLLMKVEELTLYSIEQEKKIEARDEKVESLELKVEELRKMEERLVKLEELLSK